MRSVKQFVEQCLGPGGNLHNDMFDKAMFAYQNTPCRYLGLFPGQILFARDQVTEGPPADCP